MIMRFGDAKTSSAGTERRVFSFLRANERTKEGRIKMKTDDDALVVLP